MLHDQNLQRMLWKLVRTRSRGGKVRTCETKTSNRTVLKRPRKRLIQFLSPLELTAAVDAENSAASEQTKLDTPSTSFFNVIVVGESYCLSC